MRQIIIHIPLKNAKRIKVTIPYECHEIRKEFKQINSSFWHPNQKLWSVVNTAKNMARIKNIFGNNYIEKYEDKPLPILSKPLNNKAIEALNSLEQTLVLKHYSTSSIQGYKRMFRIFLEEFMHKDFEKITKEEIEKFIYQLIQTNQISESFQNQLINAIKAYYEHVKGQAREYYDIQRPKKSVQLPNVLSQEEVLRILQHSSNIKHRAILWTIYSGGLRISEVTRLRIDDIHQDEGYIYIKDSKGKKDRKTILAANLIPLLEEYKKHYQPSYWLFEGQSGGQYSVTSIRNIFRKAVKETNSNPWATVHTLRHSFATHCIEHNINLRYIQNMLGHSSPKTTEVYTKTIQINNKNITSPLDNLFK